MGGTSDVACMDIVPAFGLVGQHAECRLPSGQPGTLPAMALWLAASDVFGHRAMLAAGVENTGSELVRRGRCPAGPSKDRIMTEDGGEGGAVVQARVLPRTPPPHTARPTSPRPDPQTSPALPLPAV